ncbi:MAG: restriction endonuclease subunit S [Hydrogenophaga sp.]|nr:restriction endonuclease subunit S [Hydrogenophaga sp.]
MNRIDTLRSMLQDDRLIWTKLGDSKFVDIRNNSRRPVKASLRTSGPNPYYGANNIQDFVDGYTHDGDHVLVAEDGSSSIEDYSIQFASNKFWANNHVHVLRGTEKLNTRFLFYFLRTVNFVPFLTGGGRPKLTKGQLVEIPIPVPCPEDPEKSLAIQADIVRILDTFDSATAELSAEVKARQKQYCYYRDKLLRFEGKDVSWKPLGDIGTWYGGGTPSKSRPEFWSNGTIPWISPKDMGEPILERTEDYITMDAVARSSTKLLPANSIAVVVRSSILEKTLPTALVPVSASLNQDMKAVVPEVGVSVHYLRHVFSSFGPDILRKARKTGGSVPSIDSTSLFSFLVPVPEFEEQCRIASSLDKFDTLANSAKAGLPREMALRQKQYNYYRDLLLSYPKTDQRAVEHG